MVRGFFAAVMMLLYHYSPLVYYCIHGVAKIKRSDRHPAAHTLRWHCPIERGVLKVGSHPTFTSRDYLAYYENNPIFSFSDLIHVIDTTLHSPFFLYFTTVIPLAPTSGLGRGKKTQERDTE